MKRRIILPPSLTSIKPVTARCVLCFILPVCISADCRTPVERRVVATLSLQSMTELYPTFAVALIWSPKGNSPSFESARALAVEKQSLDNRFALDIMKRSARSTRCSTPCVNRQIAHICAHDLLRSVANFVEAARAHAEAALAGHSRFLATRTGSPHRTSPESICMNCSTSSFGWCDVPATIERSTRNLLGVALDRI